MIGKLFLKTFSLLNRLCRTRKEYSFCQKNLYIKIKTDMKVKKVYANVLR